MQFAFIPNFKRTCKDFVSSGAKKRLEIIQRILIYFPLLIFAAVTMPFIIIIQKVLAPRIKVRIGKLEDVRIGHLSHNTDLYLRRRAMQKNSKKEFHVLFYKNPANQQLLEMIGRRVCLLRRPFFLKLYKAARACTKNNAEIWVDLPCDFAAFQEFNQILPQISFTAEEDEKGKQELRRIGLESEKEFICFIARDSAYLAEAHPYKTREKWSYHNYRNSDIHNYIKGVEYMTSQGLFAFRMGYIVENSFKSANPQIIDYAANYRSDFMDIYLTGNCKFFLSDTAGLHAVAQMLGVPVAAANWIPIDYLPPCKHDIFIPKKLWSIEEKRFLTFREIITSGADTWYSTEQYTKAGIEVIENTQDEILSLVKEMNGRLDKTCIDTPEDKKLQQRFKNIYPITHYSYNFPSRICTEFLKQNKELLE